MKYFFLFFFTALSHSVTTMCSFPYPPDWLQQYLEWHGTYQPDPRACLRALLPEVPPAALPVAVLAPDPKAAVTEAETGTEAKRSRQKSKRQHSPEPELKLPKTPKKTGITCPLCPKILAIGTLPQDHFRRTHRLLTKDLEAQHPDIYRLCQKWTTLCTLTPDSHYVAIKQDGGCAHYRCCKCDYGVRNSAAIALHFNTEHRTQKELDAAYKKCLSHSQ